MLTVKSGILYRYDPVCWGILMLEMRVDEILGLCPVQFSSVVVAVHMMLPPSPSLHLVASV